MCLSLCACEELEPEITVESSLATGYWGDFWYPGKGYKVLYEFTNGGYFDYYWDYELSGYGTYTITDNEIILYYDDDVHGTERLQYTFENSVLEIEDLTHNTLEEIQQRIAFDEYNFQIIEKYD